MRERQFRRIEWHDLAGFSRLLVENDGSLQIDGHRLIRMIGGDADHPGVFRGLDAEQGDIVIGDLHAVIAHGKGRRNHQKTLVRIQTLEPLEWIELVVRDQLELFILLKPQ